MTRPRIVLDTNVLISALLFRGAPRRVLELVIAGRADCFLSGPILDELRGVLLRPKFRFTAEQTMQVMEELHGLCQIVTPSIKVDAVPSDPADNSILECALQAKAAAIISGDAHLLALREFQGIPILSPRDFLRQAEKKR